MSGVTLSDLSKYHQGAMKWFKDGLVSEHNKLFAQTADAGAVSFWPLGGTPLEGKVKFSFKETLPASGDKGPENPSAIAGVSSVKVCHRGKNLISLPYRSQSGVIKDVTCTVRDDSSVLLNGTAGERFAFNIDNTILFHSGINYVSSGYPESSTKGYLGVSGGRYQSNGNKLNINVPSTINLGCWIEVKVGSSYSNTIVYPQIELGTIKTDYEAPMNRMDYTIPLGSTYYGGEIDLATGVMTVTHKKVRGVVGSTIQLSGDFVRTTLATSEAVKKDDSQLLCNMLPTSTDTAIERVNTRGSDEFWSINCYINKSRLDLSSAVDSSNPTTEELKSAITAWLANNQLEFVYKRTNPTTVQLTPLQLTALTQKDKYTPRMNTVYTDADSIQIRYRKSLIHDEDEKVQAIVALGGNV